MILFITANGLGNRMRAIGSLQRLAKETGHELCVVWTKEFDLNANFSDLFEETSDFSVKNIKVTKWCRNLLSHYFLYPRTTKLFRALVVNGTYIQSHSITEMKSDFKRHKLIFVRTCYEFTKEYDLSSFHFNTNVKSKSILEKIGENDRHNLIGVHIRRGDHAVSLEYSPSKLFEKSIATKKKLTPQALFYIASDNVAEKENLKSKFGDSIITQPISSFDRNTKNGIIESAVELYNLSCCQVIVGSFTSTFSEMAAKMGNSKLEILSDETKASLDDWDCTRMLIPSVELTNKEWVRYYMDYVPVMLGFNFKKYSA